MSATRLPPAPVEDQRSAELARISRAHARDLELGVITDARRRHRRRRARLAAALLALALAGAVAGAALGGGAGDPMRHAPGGGRAARLPRAHALSGAVRIAPALEGGDYGWSVIVPGAGASCCVAPVRGNRPSAETYETRAHTERLAFLAGPEVRGVLIAGRERLPVRTLARLPFGLRYDAVQFPHGRAGAVRPQAALATLLATGANGSVLAAEAPARHSDAVRWFKRPAAAPPGPCELHARGLGGLVPEWGQVASALEPLRGRIIGRAFYSCIDIVYYLHGWPLRAAILLDAARPGAPPAAIPGMRPDARAAGVLEGPGPPGEGGMLARRVGNAWLVVADGSGGAQRLRLLRALEARVRL